MSDQHTPISEEDIHAYVDGALSAARRAQVERAIELNPALAARVSDYFSLNNMFHERYDRVLNEPMPARLRTLKRRRWFAAANWPQFAGMAAALVLGIGIGVGTNMGRDAMSLSGAAATNIRNASADGMEGMARQAAIAHVVYMPAVDRPDDIGTDRDQDFVQYLSNKLGTDVHPPLLTKNGFELMGGRILPGENGPTAQFMYRGAKGERVTLCISHRKTSTNTTAFRLYQDGPVNVFYWIDGDFGYAVSGGIDRKVMLELAHDVYAQLTPSTPG
ncbi:transmembrane transcriptional regulator (anti-sigma factor) [Caballeronia cordobensis]|uniref:Transmembrane transcriptional regulator (Anti-sigma factor) n=1 Tax=Caballeronia cordobensis TaxID=1353886 RepID=A0A158G3P4_CABCO|nr:anti-sigma factor [Caballeronia cordobensis]SAL26481.1 transmembrane transcriptional regulator (anti-sigma factor) [Caballeronia cordobensis]